MEAPGYSKPEWREVGDEFDSRSAGGARVMCLFFRLRERATSVPGYVHADWLAVGDALGFRDD